MKKYVLHRSVSYPNLYQIQSLVDIPKHDVKIGDMGGFVSSEQNLSHEGNGWIDSNSFVTEQANVSGGLVCKGSFVRGKTEVKGGVVETTNISGNSKIEKGVVVQDSTLKNIVAKGAVNILSSQLGNLTLTPEGNASQVFEKVVFHAKKPMRIKKHQNWLRVELNVVKSRILAPMTLKDSVLRLKSFDVFEKAYVEHVSANNETLTFAIGKLDSMNSSYLKGVSASKPLIISASNLHVFSSQLDGMISLSGNVTLDSCQIRDYASVHMNGTIYNSWIGECSSISLETTEVHYLETICLQGDNQYKLPDNSVH